MTNTTAKEIAEAKAILATKPSCKVCKNLKACSPCCANRVPGYFDRQWAMQTLYKVGLLG